MRAMAMETFLVRVWSAGDGVDPSPGSGDALHGVVERVGSVEPQPFKSGSELVALLREARRRQREEDAEPVGDARS
jgi:hypothetical protein